MTRQMALINYRKSLTIANMLNLNKDMADGVTLAVDALVPSFLLDKSKLLRTVFDIGFYVANKSV